MFSIKFSYKNILWKKKLIMQYSMGIKTPVFRTSNFESNKNYQLKIIMWLYCMQMYNYSTFGMPGPLIVAVRCKNIIYWSQQLIHPLHIANPTICLCINIQDPFHNFPMFLVFIIFDSGYGRGIRFRPAMTTSTNSWWGGRNELLDRVID
jgi:hypothetical protein